MYYLLCSVLLMAAIAVIRVVANAAFDEGGLAVGMLFCGAGIVFFIALAERMDRQKKAERTAAREDPAKYLDLSARRLGDVPLDRQSTEREQ